MKSLTARVFLPFAAGYYVSYAFRSINALLGPEIAAEFGLGAAQLGFLTSVYFLAFALFQVPFGVLLDRYGPRRVDGGLLVVASIGAFVYASASSLYGLVVGRALIGLGVSVALMASLQAFVLWYPSERIATLNSRAFAVGILGAITVSVPVEAALGIADWRTIMVLFALISLVAAVAIFFAAPDLEREKERPSLSTALSEIPVLMSDPAFRRVAAMASTSQAALVSLSTLWIATWLRDVAGYDRPAIGRALLVVSLALIAGFLVFGRLADAYAKHHASTVPLVAVGVGLSSASLALIASGITTGAVFLWGAFTFFGSAATLGYSILSRRFPKQLAGRVNTTLNTFVFAMMFLSQWAVGLILDWWSGARGVYSPEAYRWAFGAVWLAQLAGLAWLWQGRAAFAPKRPARQ